MYERVLIPTDGSNSVTPAIQHGLSIAAKYDATVHALHVLNTTALERKQELTALPDASEMPDNWFDIGDEATDDVAARADKLGLKTVTEVQRGVPAREILTYIDDHDIELVCMGTHGRTGLQRLLLGSVAMKTVRNSPVPVLSVKPSSTESGEHDQKVVQYDDILVPIDGSKAAQAAVEHGMQLAKTYDATVHALYVVDRTHYASRPGTTWDEMEEVLSQSGQNVVNRVADVAQSEGVSITTDVVQGIPHQTITDYVDDADIDLIAMGTHGRSGTSRRVIGSVSERVLRTTTCPVLTARR